LLEWWIGHETALNGVAGHLDKNGEKSVLFLKFIGRGSPPTKGLIAKEWK